MGSHMTRAWKLQIQAKFRTGEVLVIEYVEGDFVDPRCLALTEQQLIYVGGKLTTNKGLVVDKDPLLVIKVDEISSVRSVGTTLTVETKSDRHAFRFATSDEASAIKSEILIQKSSDGAKMVALLDSTSQPSPLPSSLPTPDPHREAIAERDASLSRHAVRTGQKIAISTVAVGMACVLGWFFLFQGTSTEDDTSLPRRISETSTAPATSTRSSQSPSATTETSTRPVPSTIDSIFIDALDSSGMDYGSPSEAIRTAKAACANLNVGGNTADNVEALADIMYMTGGLSRSQAELFVGYSIHAYCPEYKRYVSF